MKLGSSKVISNTLRVVIWLRSDQSLSRKGEKVEFIYLKEKFHTFSCVDSSSCTEIRSVEINFN